MRDWRESYDDDDIPPIPSTAPTPLPTPTTWDAWAALATPPDLATLPDPRYDLTPEPPGAAVEVPFADSPHDYARAALRRFAHVLGHRRRTPDGDVWVMTGEVMPVKILDAIIENVILNDHWTDTWQTPGTVLDGGKVSG